jgi:hypothetical protein
MRRHDLVYNPIRAPTAVRRVVQMRSEGFNDLFEMLDLAHE